MTLKRIIFSCLGLMVLPAGRGAETPAGPGAAPEEREGEVLLRAAENLEAVAPPDFEDADRKEERRAMVEEQINARGVEEEKVLEAMRRVPRHRLVSERQRSAAYRDRPLPIGHGQTISQPYIVGMMTETLDLDPGDRVLEVGTGSGYQAAILAQIVEEVVTVEIVGPLAERAAEDLEALGYENITVILKDGYFGHEPKAPYDAIIVTAAAERVPPPLMRQLKPGGRMVIPVGESGWTQNLLLVDKGADGEVTTRNLMPVRFVPFTRR